MKRIDMEEKKLEKKNRSVWIVIGIIIIAIAMFGEMLDGNPILLTLFIVE